MASEVTQMRVMLQRGGYSPTPLIGKVPVLPQWQARAHVNIEEIEAWEPFRKDATNTGILTEYNPTADIDLLIEEAAEAIEYLAKERFGDRGLVLPRIGKWPKRAIVFRTDKPFAKITRNLIAPNGDTSQKLEMLARGQQVVVHGIHPDTRQPYLWAGGDLGEHRSDELPHISEAEAVAFMDDAVALLVREHGYKAANDERPRKDRTNGADHQPMYDASDWGVLLGRIDSGEALHDTAASFTAKLVAAGMSAGAIYNLTAALYERSTGAQARKEYPERIRDLPRAIKGAVSKYARAQEPERPADLHEWEVNVDPGIISPRQWLLGNQFCRGFISSVVAAGGTGKSALRLLQFISLVTGRPLCGQHVFQRCRVLLISLEDDDDELQRRIKAVLDHHNIPRSELAGLFCATPKLSKLAMMNGYERVLGPLEQQLRDAIQRRKPDLISLDPFVKTHSLGENDSGDMDFVCDLLARIAVEFNVAVDSPHHTHKGQTVPGDADSGRGSSGIRDAGRLVYTLCPMSEDEAALFSIPSQDRRAYIRLDPAKVNIAPPLAKAEWFRLVGVNIGNGTPEYPAGDTVQVAEPWAPPDAWEGTTAADLNTVLDEIERGLVDGEGKPTGQRFSNAPAATERAVWPVVQRHYPGKSEAQCREIVHKWLVTGLLYSGDYDDAVDRKRRKGLHVDQTKRPGATT